MNLTLHHVIKFLQVLRLKLFDDHIKVTIFNSSIKEVVDFQGKLNDLQGKYKATLQELNELKYVIN